MNYHGIHTLSYLSPMSDIKDIHTLSGSGPSSIHATLIHNWDARRWICEPWPMYRCWWLQPPSANVVRFMKINQWTNIYIKKVEHTCWNTYLGLHKWCWRYTNLMCTRGLYYTGCWPKRGTNNGNWSLQSQNDIA